MSHNAGSLVSKKSHLSVEGLWQIKQRHVDTAPQPGNTTQFPWPVSSLPRHTDTKTEMDSPHTNTDSPDGSDPGNSLLLQ